jgi:outer membrane lipoprotein-sorting protein
LRYSQEEPVLRIISFFLVFIACISLPVSAAETDARALVKTAIDHWRGTSSYGEMTMTIHRPTWERTMSMRSWTEGDKKALVRITAPRKDVGNGTLMDDGNMWSYTPKVNRVIKIPSSMMSQGWMGSDFSNKDIAKSDEIVDQYTHTLLETSEENGHTIYLVESVPHEDAAVVWGKKVLKIRDDYVMLEDQFWDQDGVLVKTMITLEIAEMGGRAVARHQRMVKTEHPQEWTEVINDTMEFDVELSPNIFTLSSLRNPRQ